MGACTNCHEVLVIEREYQHLMDYNFNHYVSVDSIMLCSSCIFNAGYDFCTTCEQQSYHIENEECAWCARSDSEVSVGTIHNYSYRPTLVFHPEVHDNPTKPLYIGMEVEIEFGDRRAEAVSEWLPSLEPKGLFFAKGDGSIHHGFELVTQPFDPKWARDNFPLDRFQELIDDYTAQPTASTCGTHIHMSKEAFTMAHLWKMLSLHENMPKFLGALGGRGTDAGYARFDASIEQEKAHRLAFVKAKGQGAAFRIERSRAVNLLNEETIELRYPRGGCAPQEVGKNIDLAQCLYDFTDFVEIGDVKDGAFKDAGFLLSWINEGDYPYLQDWVQAEMPSPRKLKERIF